jgi:hypothetical protein
MMKIHLALLPWIICGSVSFILSLPCQAAEIHFEKSKLYLNGEIHQGDAEKMVSAFSQAPLLSQLIVNSVGGDMREALKVAKLVSGSRIGVVVEKGGYCVSACFFIFLDGYWRTAGWAQADGTLESTERRKRFFGAVGIHRPYLKSTDGGLQAIQTQENLMRIVRSHLVSKSTPQYLIDEMMGRPSNDIYWLKARDLEALGEYDPWIEEALIAKCGYKRVSATVDENWSVDKLESLNRCAVEYWDREFLPQQRKFLNDLKTGWRPWVKK